jgi:PHD/YefM family antitoxin component YafN of YafNO toxin-antitoxin module
MSDVIPFPYLLETSTPAATGQTSGHDLTANIKMSDIYAAPVQSAAPDSKHAQMDTLTAFIQIPSPLPATVTGWRNQELADLYRTQRILALAGITTKVDHGLTDEGDPWFVFMDSQDEVFVHFSWFDGFYMVTSQMQEKPIKGDNLQDLVSEFSKRVKPVTEAGRAGQNVVSIAGRSPNAVLIHPVAALAALVWSIYLMSDDLVAATPMIPADEADSAADGPQAMIPADLPEVASDLDVLPEVAQKALQVLFDPALVKQVVDPYAGRDTGSAAAQTAAMSSGMSMNAVYLSLVAISVGLPLIDGTTDEAQSGTTSNQLSIEQLYMLIMQANEAALSLMIATDYQQPRMELTNQINDDMPAKTPIDALGTTQGIDPKAEFAAIVDAIATSYDAEVPLALTEKQDLTSLLHQDDAPVLAESSNAVQDASAVDTSFLQRFDTSFESFSLTNLDRLAQNELAELMGTSDTTYNPELIVPIENTNQYDTFDQEARMFLDFLLQTHTDIKIVNQQSEIIFIHVDAFEMADADDPIYAKSWSFDDGGIISVIGLKSDMAQFDLIA